MQRRLSIALMATALASILLVGFGVLALAQIGSRSSAQDRINDKLPALADAYQGGLQRRGPNEADERFRNAFGFDEINLVVVTDEGDVIVANRREGRLEPGRKKLTLDSDQLQRFADGETVTLELESRSVSGLRSTLNFDAADFEDGNVRGPRPPEGTSAGVLATERTLVIARQAVLWFVMSSLAVLVGAAVAGTWLARRLVRPIQAIKETTSAIADGDLSARADVAGSDEVADLGFAVNKMAADLERSHALDRQFLMSISHDLRTPLTAISGYAEALSDGAIADPRAAGETIRGQALRLDHLVGDLLDLARLDAKRFRLNRRPVDVSVVTGRTVAGLKHKAEQASLTLTSIGDDQAIANVDPDRLSQAIANLVENAIKFAAKTVVVEVEASGASITIAVIDDGPGIADEDLPYIFDRLYTGKAQPERAENSTGLGLAIVRELINAMDGTTLAANNPAGGARLTVELPRHGTRYGSGADQTSSEADLTSTGTELGPVVSAPGKSTDRLT